MRGIGTPQPDDPAASIRMFSPIPDKSMPLPLVAVGVGVKVIKTVGPVVEKLGKAIGGLFKSKKKKKAEAAAKKAAAEKVFQQAPASPTYTTVGLPNIGVGTQEEKKKIPVIAWIIGGVALLTTLFLIFKRKR